MFSDVLLKKLSNLAQSLSAAATMQHSRTLGPECPGTEAVDDGVGDAVDEVGA